jgi:cytochrome P450
MMSEFETLDWFTDPHVHQDPYPYYEHLRSKGPAVRLPHHGVVAVTDYELALRVFRDDERYSMVKAVLGPFPPLPFTPKGDDISAQIETFRPTMPNTALIMAMDDPQHSAHRALLMGVITPRRLQENEAFIHRLTDRQIATFIDRGRCEVVEELSHPLATLVVADLLGLPEGFHERLLELLPASHSATLGRKGPVAVNPLEALDAELKGFIQERRDAPRADVLTNLARAKFPDGSVPDVADVVNIASFMFAAGQDTTVRLIAMALQVLGDNQDLQELLRGDRDRIPDFVEEVLRLESPSKVGGFRLARVPTKIGDVEVRPGDLVMLMIGAANRDPARFEQPNALRLDRKNLHDQLAFGRGPHSCIGAPLARAEVRIALNRILDHTASFWVSEARHGPLGERRYQYIPRYTGRGLAELHLEFLRN